MTRRLDQFLVQNLYREVLKRWLEFKVYRANQPKQGFALVTSLKIEGVVEGMALGLDIAFLIFGFGRLRRVASGSKGLAWATYVSIGWALVSLVAAQKFLHDYQ